MIYDDDMTFNLAPYPVSSAGKEGLPCRIQGCDLLLHDRPAVGRDSRCRPRVFGKPFMDPSLVTNCQARASCMPGARSKGRISKISQSGFEL